MCLYGGVWIGWLGMLMGCMDRVSVWMGGWEGSEYVCVGIGVCVCLCLCVFYMCVCVCVWRMRVGGIFFFFFFFLFFFFFRLFVTLPSLLWSFRAHANSLVPVVSGTQIETVWVAKYWHQSARRSFLICSAWRTQRREPRGRSMGNSPSFPPPRGVHGIAQDGHSFSISFWFDCAVTNQFGDLFVPACHE